MIAFDFVIPHPAAKLNKTVTFNYLPKQVVYFKIWFPNR